MLTAAVTTTLTTALPAAAAGLPWPTLGVAGTGFVLGCRHGLDWDHIAAITDLTTATTDQPDPQHPGQRQPQRQQQRRSLGLAVWYCIGHGLVIGLLGA